MKPSRSEFVPVRGLRYHVRRWGPAEGRRLIMLHGWMDVSATFQFLADALSDAWHVVAPDWRGFGQSTWTGGPYWFPDYVADLDVLLDHYSPDAPAHLVGASMGGNVACLYAGLRPERVASITTLEGFGLASADPEESPDRLAKWLDQLQKPVEPKVYRDFETLAERLCHKDPLLRPTRAHVLARQLGRQREDGSVELAADPYHRLVNPVLYRLEEVKACWRRIAAPVLWVVARESPLLRRFVAHDDDYRDRLACFRNLREIVLDAAGHNLQQHQPERLAALIEEFLADGGRGTV
ncbi:MAG: alpha/beta hydrolase [Rhodocyclaceae bacterium]